MLDWSYELLDDAEKQLFARLSVFAGGWTLAAAEAVAAGEAIAKEEVVFVLIALIEKSVVEADDDRDRYRLLETVREYAKDKLAERREVMRCGSGIGTISWRWRRKWHRNSRGWSRRNACVASTKSTVTCDRHWNGDLVEPGSEAGLRLCSALRRFWWTCGHFSEGREWCTRVLAKAGPQERTTARANALSAAGLLAYWQGDYFAARARHEEALAIRHDLGDRKGIAAIVAATLAWLPEFRAITSARGLYEESLAIMRELGDRWGVAASLNNLGSLAYDQYDYAMSRALHEESLAIMRELQDRGSIATSLENLGNVAYEQGDFASAYALMAESLTTDSNWATGLGWSFRWRGWRQ